MLQVDTPVEDIVLVEDASSDDDADSYVSMVTEDPLLVVAVTDGSTMSTRLRLRSRRKSHNRHQILRGWRQRPLKTSIT